MDQGQMKTRLNIKERKGGNDGLDYVHGE
jgi:hypothetical protein